MEIAGIPFSKVQFFQILIYRFSLKSEAPVVNKLIIKIKQ